VSGRPCGCGPTSRRARRATWARRGLDTARWLLPATVLTLLPKCPACLAAYLAIGTGVGLSVTAAVYLRAILVAVCIGSLAYLCFQRVHRSMNRPGVPR
jgi:hypothetical protein